MKMTEKHYIKERERLLRYYEKLEKKYIHQQSDSRQLAAIQHEKNDRLTLLAERYHNQ